MIASTNIELKGVRVNNLKNINVDIPQNKLVVITGLSGSGKSSLAFDTLYAEGQRRYVESLSSYARQFLGRMNKPEVDFISGIPPAIAIQQRVNTRNPRSTVGTTTEIYDYLKLLFARIGRTYSPISGKEVKRHTVTDVVDACFDFPIGSKLLVCFKYNFNNKQDKTEQLELISNQGYSRIIVDNKLEKISDQIDKASKIKSKYIHIAIDRIVTTDKVEQASRLADSISSAFYEGQGVCEIVIDNANSLEFNSYSNLYEADGIEFEIPNESLFSFNNPLGACPVCEGFGKVLGVDEDLVIPDKSLSIYDNAVACWRGEIMQEWKKEFILKSVKYDFPVHRAYYELNQEEKDILWNGKDELGGINYFFKYLESHRQKIQYRVMISRYRGKTICPECGGKRLRKEAFYVLIDGKSIAEFIDAPITDILINLRSLKLNEYEKQVADRLINEIVTRLNAIVDVGLGYLSLNRLSSTLSGGESQRISLASIFGSGLVGALYVLDEPSIGLHPRDTIGLIKILRKLRDAGNTVVVVEHDEEIIKAADYIIDIGPRAGNFGGEVVYAGTVNDMLKNSESLTALYLKGSLENPKSSKSLSSNKYIEIVGARHHNLKNIDVKFPLGVITVVTGVSGSGKSSLVKGILFPAVKKKLGLQSDKIGDHTSLNGDFNLISNIEYVDQNPIGRSSRSNPASYIKAYDEIRKLFADQKLSKVNGYKPSHFSFNVNGGRCEVCQGEGTITVEMQFMADVHLTCEACAGKRFKEEILNVKYRDKNISEILEMSVEEAVAFFGAEAIRIENKIVELLQHYIDVGLEYVKLGQPSNTLSGGESQRVKLASFLSHDKLPKTVFVFDEPTTGLHFYDIGKLLVSFSKMRSKGHTIIIIEHNPEVIRFADYIIDLGHDGGANGGYLVFSGSLSEFEKCKMSETKKFI